MARKSVNWEEVEKHYRAGIRSLKDIGKEFSVSDAGIIKKAKAEGWERDLHARIQAKAEAKVSAAQVSKLVSEEQLVSDEAIVETNAQVIADTVLLQRKDVKTARSVVNSLFAELEKQLGDNVELLDQLGELMRAENDKGQDQLNDLYRKVISLPGRTDTAKKLVEAMEKAINLERKVLRIKDDANFEDFAKAAAGTIMSAADAYKRMLEG